MMRKHIIRQLRRSIDLRYIPRVFLKGVLQFTPLLERAFVL